LIYIQIVYDLRADLIVFACQTSMHRGQSPTD